MMSRDKRRTFEICPICGRLRSRFDSSGECQVCRERERYESYLARQSSVYMRLPIEAKARYDAFDSKLASRCDSLPREPERSGLGPAAARRAELEHAARCEDIEAANYRRMSDAVKQRTSRMRRHL